MPFSSKEDGLPNSSTALLSSNADSYSPLPPPSRSLFARILFAFLLLSAMSAAVALAFLFFSASSYGPLLSHGSAREVSKHHSKLKKPVVLMVSCDGFRFGYQFKTDTPNIDRLIKAGTEAELGLIPSFPTLTFPNHYSIVTGLYPAYHGIINNYFKDPVTGERFTRGNNDPKWWLGEPLWETVANHGLKASAYFWPGSEVKKGKWDCPKDFCPPYNQSVSFEERVDTVLKYFDLPSQEIPSFMALYLSDPDSQGHRVGPDDPRLTEAVSNIDKVIGRLIRGLEERGIFDDVTFILLGDHGMAGICEKKTIYLEDLAKWIEIPEEWVDSDYPLFALSPPSGNSSEVILAKIKEALESGEVENGEYLKVYLKKDFPSRLHYSDSDRIPPIIGLLDEGFKLEFKRSNNTECGGAHGYDNALFSMRTIFIGHGPRFAKGRKIPSFQNIEIYNLVTKILKIKGAPNNGTKSFTKGILLGGH